jgi:hypothetical protein
MKLEISFETPLRIITDATASAEPRAIVTLQFENNAVRGENMASKMAVGTYATVSVEWKDKGGNTVGVEKGSIKWASSDDATVQCQVATGNPQIANLYAPGPIGHATIQATGDADLGEGVKAVTASLDVEVIGGQATGGEITFSQDVSQGGGPEGGGSRRSR